jgi:hypothetical protein
VYLLEFFYVTSSKRRAEKRKLHLVGIQMVMRGGRGKEEKKRCIVNS